MGESYVNRRALTGKELDRIRSLEADLVNRLPQVNLGSNVSYKLDSTRATIHLTLVKTVLNDLEAQNVFDHFTLKGYNGPVIENLNDVFKSRFYYNFVRADGVFNTVEPAIPGMRFTSAQKQLLAETFARGITIWHYRGHIHWNGFRNYQYENWEHAILKRLNIV